MLYKKCFARVNNCREWKPFTFRKFWKRQFICWTVNQYNSKVLWYVQMLKRLKLEAWIFTILHTKTIRLFICPLTFSFLLPFQRSVKFTNLLISIWSPSTWSKSYSDFRFQTLIYKIYSRSIYFIFFIKCYYISPIVLLTLSKKDLTRIYLKKTLHTCMW